VSTPPPDTKYKYAVVVVRDWQDEEVDVIIPYYAFEKIQEYDHKFLVKTLHPKLWMYYFDKEGPNHKNPGHAFAIIIDKYNGRTYMFQSTIGESQRFFIYIKGYPHEVSKPDYRTYLLKITEKDKGGAQ
jgi:hypothetical protein